MVWDSGPTVHEDGTPRNDDDGDPSGVAPPPIDNTPPRPELGYGGDPHEFPRSTAESRRQKDAFYRPNGAVVDTCGAGDSFIATFLAAFQIDRKPAAEALRAATAAASQTCLYVGGFRQQPRRIPEWLLSKYASVIAPADGA